MTIRYTTASPNGGGNEFIDCEDSTAVRFRAKSNGGLSNYSANNTNLSDQREKKDIELAGNYLDKICAIPVKTFNAAVGTTVTLPNSPSFSSNTFTSGSATTLYIDGYTPTVNDVILVKNESTTTRNGVYYVLRAGSASTTWQLRRSTSFDSTEEVVSNTLVRVENGTVNSDSKWYLTTPDPITLNTTGLTFSNTKSSPTNAEVATTGTSISVSNLESLTIDDIAISSLSVGSYVLVKDQVDEIENGVYLKSSTGWLLATTAYSVPFKVLQGTINDNTYWYKNRIPVN
jgi:hypothetical protein